MKILFQSSTSDTGAGDQISLELLADEFGKKSIFLGISLYFMRSLSNRGSPNSQFQSDVLHVMLRVKMC